MEVDFTQKRQKCPLGFDSPTVNWGCLIYESMNDSTLPIARKCFYEETVMYYEPLPSVSQKLMHRCALV